MPSDALGTPENARWSMHDSTGPDTTYDKPDEQDPSSPQATRHLFSEVLVPCGHPTLFSSTLG